ncbi:hypothetical protein ACXYN8_11055 [Altererythrobacter sp. CAU 1778]
MSLRFAAARQFPRARMSRHQVRSAMRTPANDCGAAPAELDEVLRAALSHLTQHGLDAPKAAHRHALAALRAGDREAFKRWTAICRTFDRRAARALDRLDAHQSQGETASSL